MCGFLLQERNFNHLLINITHDIIKIYYTRRIKMKKTIGKVIEVSIPEQYKNGLLLDVMDRTVTLFKIYTKEGIKEITIEDNEETAYIRKDDLVMIIEQTISGKDFIDIRKFNGDNYE